MLQWRSCLFIALLAGAVVHSAAWGIEIRTTAQDSQPKFIARGTEIGGLCVDIFEALGRIDPALKFSALKEFEPLSRIEYKLRDGSYDAFCGMAKTGERQAKFDFIDVPLYLTHSVLAARSDDTAEITSFDDLGHLGDDGLVLVVANSMHASVLAGHRGVRYSDAARSTKENFRLLLLGRGRFIFHSDFALADEIARDHLGDKIKLLPAQFLTEGRYVAVSRKAAPEVKERLTAALEKLNKSGELAKIYKTYQPR